MSKETKAQKQKPTPVIPEAVGGIPLPLEPQIYMFVGKPKSGKSTCIRKIMHAYKKVDYFKFGVVFCPTVNDDYNWMGDRKRVIHDFSTERLLKYFKGMWEKQEKLKEEGKSSKLPPNFVILDDCLSTMNFQEPEVQNLIARYRHTGTTIFFAAQYLVGVQATSTAFREFTNTAFIWGQKTQNSINGVWRAYGQDFKLDEYKELLKEATREPHYCLVVRTDIPERKDGKYKRFKCDVAPDFTFESAKKKDNNEMPPHLNGYPQGQYGPSHPGPIIAGIRQFLSNNC